MLSNILPVVFTLLLIRIKLDKTHCTEHFYKSLRIIITKTMRVSDKPKFNGPKTLERSKKILMGFNHHT